MAWLFSPAFQVWTEKPTQHAGRKEMLERVANDELNHHTDNPR